MAVQKADPSGRLGYEAHNIILTVDGHIVYTFEEWVWYVEENVPPGQAVELALWWLGEIINVKVTPARAQCG